MSGTTPNYHWILPTVGGDASTWGLELNTTIGLIDGQVKINEQGVTDLDALLSDNILNLSTSSAFVVPSCGITFNNHDAGSIRWYLHDNGVAETGGNAGSDLAINAYSDTGVFLSTPLRITRATGGASFSSTLNVVGALAVGGAATFGSTLSANGAATAAYFLVNGSTTALEANTLQFNTGWTIISGGSIQFNSPGGELAEMDVGGAFGITGQAYKPGGGSWVNSSDLRIKTIERPYALGLDAIRKLNPIVYRFKGNDAKPGKVSKTQQVRDKSFVGLVAQDVESVFPGMVTKRKGFVDGKEVNDLRDLDTSELVFALVNAIKTLARRVEELEAK